MKLVNKNVSQYVNDGNVKDKIEVVLNIKDIKFPENYTKSQ